jgi:predicted nucleotidyltransferase
MRLQHSQIDSITSIVTRYAGNGCRIFLFGSRINDSARGGDVDLFVESPNAIPRIQQARLKMEIELAIRLPVDLIVKSAKSMKTPFEKIIRSQAIQLLQQGQT